jgi:hypothetical protein
LNDLSIGSAVAVLRFRGCSYFNRQLIGSDFNSGYVRFDEVAIVGRWDRIDRSTDGITDNALYLNRGNAVNRSHPISLPLQEG